MQKKTQDAIETFTHFVPQLMDLSEAVRNCRLPPHERARLAQMIVDYYMGLASELEPPKLRLVRSDAPRPCSHASGS